MERCVRCGRNEEEIRLFDGIYVSEIVKICEKCSLLSNIPIIKRPSADQLKESEKPYGVRERLSRMAHIPQLEDKKESIYEEIKKLEKEPDLERPEGIKLRLVDNYHWILQTSRRRKGLSAGQLAEMINESSSAIEMLEKNKAPEGAFNLIRKLEQFFNIRIMKRDISEIMQEETKIEIIPITLRVSQMTEIEKPKKEIKEEMKKESKSEIELGYINRMRDEEANEMVREAILTEKNPKIVAKEEVNGVPLRILDFRKVKTDNLTIAELKQIQKKIEMDLDAGKKTKEEVGREQLEDFGKEDITRVKRRIEAEAYEKQESKGRVPTIYELVDKKKEKEDRALLGKDIEIEDLDKEQ